MHEQKRTKVYILIHMTKKEMEIQFMITSIPFASSISRKSRVFFGSASSADPHNAVKIDVNI